MSGVVNKDGTGKNAALNEYEVCGKTGTAQKWIKNEYSHKNYIASFLGFAPANNPKVAVLVVIDNPKGDYYGGVVAAPIFKEVVHDTLKYMNVKPDFEYKARAESNGEKKKG